MVYGFLFIPALRRMGGLCREFEIEVSDFQNDDANI